MRMIFAIFELIHKGVSHKEPSPQNKWDFLLLGVLNISPQKTTNNVNMPLRVTLYN
jgi:hypothetical protein